MKPPLYESTAVASFGWEPIKSGAIKGNVHVQFKNKGGELTHRGYYAEVQRPIFLGLEASMKPGRFIHDNLKGHFEWVSTNTDTNDAAGMDFNRDEYANPLVIPADCPNTVEAIWACYETQRLQPKREGLFE